MKVSQDGNKKEATIVLGLPKLILD